MSADLKPCPFCRAPDEELALCYDAGTHPLVGTDWFVRCYVCHVETARFVAQAEAVTAWNTRAEGPAPVSAPLDRKAVAWRMLLRNGSVLRIQSEPFHDGFAQMMAADCGCTVEPLYAVPAPTMDRAAVEITDAMVAAGQAALHRRRWGRMKEMIDGGKLSLSVSDDEVSCDARACLEAALALSQQDQVGLTTPAVEGRGDRSEAIAYFEAFVKRKDEMDRMGYGLRAEEWPGFVSVMRAALTTTQSEQP